MLNPLNFAGASMDFGLDKLVEMIEERFGRWAANGLLLIVGLGAAAFGIHAFVSYLLVPVSTALLKGYAYIQFGHYSVSPYEFKQLAARFIAGLIGSVASGFILFVVYALIARRPLRRDLKELEFLKKEIEIGLATYQETVRAAMASGIDADLVENEIQRRIASVQDVASPSQLPKDTGSKTPP